METIYSVTIGIEPWLAFSDKLTPSLLFHITMISRPGNRCTSSPCPHTLLSPHRVTTKFTIRDIWTNRNGINQWRVTVCDRNGQINTSLTYLASELNKSQYNIFFINFFQSSWFLLIDLYKKVTDWYSSIHVYYLKTGLEYKIFSNS